MKTDTIMAAAKMSQQAREWRPDDVTGASFSVRSAPTDEAGSGFMVAMAPETVLTSKDGAGRCGGRRPVTNRRYSRVAVGATLAASNVKCQRALGALAGKQGRAKVLQGRLTAAPAISGLTWKMNSRPRWTTKVIVSFRVSKGKVGKL